MFVHYGSGSGSGTGFFPDPDPSDPKRQDPDPQHCYILYIDTEDGSGQDKNI